MSDPAEDPRPVSSSSRRTVVLLAAWVVAAVVAGVPAGASTSASADGDAGTSVSVVNTGPECFAGRSAPAGGGHDAKGP